jgi:hypothetical protein
VLGLDRKQSKIPIGLEAIQLIGNKGLIPREEENGIINIIRKVKN